MQSWNHSEFYVNFPTASDKKQFSPMMISKLVTLESHAPITVELITAKFGIGLDSTKITLMMQQGIREEGTQCTPSIDCITRIIWRYTTRWFTDRLDARYKSMQESIGAYVITYGKYTKFILERTGHLRQQKTHWWTSLMMLGRSVQ